MSEIYFVSSPYSQEIAGSTPVAPVSKFKSINHGESRAKCC